MNRVHQCSIVLPDHAELLPDVGADVVFQFRLGHVVVRCEAIRRIRLRERLRCSSEEKVVDDEKFFAGEFPARIVLFENGTGGRSRQFAWYLVETTRAVYRFHASGESLPDEVRKQLRGVLESFRLVDAESSEI
ncbi:MAG: hypothetical protein ACYC3X_13465 [Pirellulaceae bacterium]